MIRAASRHLAVPAPDDVGRRILLYLIPAAVCYGAMLSIIFGPLGPVDNGLTFNSMLLHLLHGRFDVDPDAVGFEGFIRGNSVYSYFGVFPAVLRLPFLALPHFATTDFTRISCTLAVTLMAAFKLLAALTVWRSTATPSRRADHGTLLILLCAAILFGGAQVQFLRASLYQEVLLWSAALSAGFLYVVVHGWLARDGFTPAHLRWLALLAGLCLMTRVSSALGLYIALALIGLCFWRSAGRDRRRALLGPAAILAGFVALAGWINFARWGNPLVFADLRLALLALHNYPDRIPRLGLYGEFNLDRLPYGLSYYFLPWWALQTGTHVLSPMMQPATIDATELPPGSLFLSDPLLIGLGACGLIRLVRDRAMARRAALAGAAAGFFVPVFLMLTAISMTFRYRLEFYPLLELCALVGFRRLLTMDDGYGLRAFRAGAIGEIAMGNLAWLLYIVSPLGPAAEILGHTGVIGYYLKTLH